MYEKLLFPVNKTASVVTSKGEHYKPKIESWHNCTDAPIQTKKVKPSPDFIDLTRRSKDKLTVVGFHGRRGVHGYWVCRCVCSNYTLRKTKTIKNWGKSDTNSVEACEECLKIERLKWQFHNKS